METRSMTWTIVIWGKKSPWTEELSRMLMPSSTEILMMCHSVFIMPVRAL